MYITLLVNIALVLDKEEEILISPGPTLLEAKQYAKKKKKDFLSRPSTFLGLVSVYGIHESTITHTKNDYSSGRAPKRVVPLQLTRILRWLESAYRCAVFSTSHACSEIVGTSLL
jgi:hypothetical protein